MYLRVHIFFFSYKNFIRQVICVFENWLRYRVSNFPPRAHGRVWGLRLHRGSSFRVVLELKLDLGLGATRDEICCIVLELFFLLKIMEISSFAVPKSFQNRVLPH